MAQYTTTGDETRHRARLGVERTVPEEPGDRTPPRVGLSYEDPFATPREQRRADRRLRGRLPSPVTVWTAGSGLDRAGLTVSSVAVAEGDPPHLVALLDPLSGLHEALDQTGRAVIHLLGASDGALGRLFAGNYPGDPFAEVAFEETADGPVFEGLRPRAHARFVSSEEVGFRALVRLRLEEIFLDAPNDDPLILYRGEFRSFSRPGG